MRRPLPHPAGCAPVAEPLEPRIVLSDTYYAWMGVEKLPGFAPEYGDADSIRGVSDNSQFFWSTATGNPSDSSEPYIIDRGVVRYLRDIPQLADATIAGINSSGIALAAGKTGEDLGRIFLFDLVNAGDRRYLDQADLRAPAGFNLATMVPNVITDGGGIVLLDGGDPQSRQDAWIVIDSEVTFLWTGWVTDTNSQNGVIGAEYHLPDDQSFRYWRPDQGLVDTEAAGMQAGGSLNNDGSILTKHDGDLAVWHNGEFESLGYKDSAESSDRRSSDYGAVGRDITGRFVVRETWFYGSSWGRDVLAGSPDGRVNIPAKQGPDFDWLSISELGIILAGFDNREGSGGWFAPVDVAPALLAAPGATPVSWYENGVFTTLTRDAEGRWIEYAVTEDGAVSLAFSAFNGDAADAEEWAVITSRESGRTLVVRTADGGFSWLDPGDQDLARSFVLAAGHIDHGVAGFFGPRDRPVVVGLSAEGHVLIAFDRPASEAVEPRLADLSAEHLGRRGLDTPDFVGQLDAFRTPWGGQHIVGIDSEGAVHDVWWGPGLHSQLWTTTNISQAAGAPRLRGNITAECSPWGGIQIMGTDESGKLIALWWSPGSRGWQAIDISERVATGRALAPGSLSLLIGNDGVMSVVGRAMAGDPLIFRWGLDYPYWFSESLKVILGRQSPDTTSVLSQVLAAGAEHRIYATDPQGHVIEMRFTPPLGSEWRWQSLAIGAMV